MQGLPPAETPKRAILLNRDFARRCWGVDGTMIGEAPYWAVFYLWTENKHWLISNLHLYWEHTMIFGRLTLLWTHFLRVQPPV
jgi:hypothetical protein